MVAETQVKFICSDNYNVPTLSNNFGVLISVLDVVLVNGCTLPAISSVVIDANNLRIIFSENHQLKLFQVLKLSDFKPDVYNSEYRIIGVPNLTTVEIGLSNEPVEISKIGKALIAPLGYEKSYSGVNKAAYRNADENAEYRPYLRVDNSLDSVYDQNYAKYAKVGILKTMSDIDDLAGEQIPYDVNSPLKNWIGTGSGSTALNGWAKWYYARATSPYAGSIDATTISNGNRKWMVVGDENAFYLLTATIVDSKLKMIYGFGVYKNYIKNGITPYFLASTLNYVNVSTSQDFSVITNAIPFLYKKEASGVLLFDNVLNSAQDVATPSHGLYTSGNLDTYANSFVVRPYIFLASNYLVGEAPHIRYIDKKRSDADFTSTSFENTMYVIDTVMNGGTEGRIAFNLGSL